MQVCPLIYYVSFDNLTTLRCIFTSNGRMQCFFDLISFTLPRWSVLLIHKKCSCILLANIAIHFKQITQFAANLHILVWLVLNECKHKSRLRSICRYVHFFDLSPRFINVVIKCTQGAKTFSERYMFKLQ